MFRASQFPADTDHFVPRFTVHFISLYRALRFFLCSGGLDPEFENPDLKIQHLPIAQAAFLSSLHFQASQN